MYDGVSPLGASVSAWSPAESSCDLYSWWFKSVLPAAICKGTQWWYIWALPPTLGWDCPLSTLSSKAVLHQFVTAVIISMFSWRNWVNVLSILNNIHSVIVGHRNCVRWVQCIIYYVRTLITILSPIVHYGCYAASWHWEEICEKGKIFTACLNLIKMYLLNLICERYLVLNF